MDYIKGMLAQKKKVPGFGHRVYHTEDPRATHLRTMSRDLGASSGNPKWFDMSHKIEEFIVADRKQRLFPMAAILRGSVDGNCGLCRLVSRLSRIGDCGIPALSACR